MGKTFEAVAVSRDTPPPRVPFANNWIAGAAGDRRLRSRLIAILRRAHRVLGFRRDGLGLGMLSGGARGRGPLAVAGGDGFLINAARQVECCGACGRPRSEALRAFVKNFELSGSRAIGAALLALTVLGLSSTGASATTYGPTNTPCQPAGAPGPDGVVAPALNPAADGSGVWSNIIGCGASGNGQQGVQAMGASAEATGAGGVALGYYARGGTRGTAVGMRAFATGVGSSAFGQWAEAQGAGSIAIGGASTNNTRAMGALAVGANTIALGGQSRATRSGDIAIGFGANTDSQTDNFSAVAIGYQARANGEDTTALGNNARAIGDYGTALGNFALANQTNATAVGNSASAAGASASAFGNFANAAGANSVAIGTGRAFGNYLGAGALATGSVAIGGNLVNPAVSLATDGLAIGGESRVDNNATSGIAFGRGAFVASAATYGIAAGDGAAARQANDIAVGRNASTNAGSTGNNIAVGNGVTTGATGQNVAMGSGTTTANSATAGGGAVAIGRSQTAIGDGAVAIGDPNRANGSGSIAMGRDNTAAGSADASTAANGAVAIGDTNSAIGQGSVALGRTSTAAAAGAVAMGDTANARATRGIAIGSAADAGATSAAGALVDTWAPDSTQRRAEFTGANTAIGANAVSNNNGTAVGNSAQATGNASFAGGAAAVASGRVGVAVGGGSLASGDSTIAIGNTSTASGAQSAAVGTGSEATGNRSAAFGPVAFATGDQSLAAGNMSRATATSAIALGNSAQSSAANALAIGANARAANADAVALGSGSQTTAAVGTASTVIAGTTYNFAGTAPGSTVSVGDAGAERTITNVAAGRISGTSTDAINGSQLYATNQAVEALNAGATHYYSVNDGGTQGGNYNNDGALGFNSIAAGVGAQAQAINGLALGYNARSIGPGGIAIGEFAEAHGESDVYLGGAAGANGQAGNYRNTGVGERAGTAVAGADNTAIGATTGNTVAGTANFAGGAYSGSNVTGSYNIAIGGVGSSCVGDLLVGSLSSGSGSGLLNCAPAGISAGVNVTGSNNIALGPAAGSNLTGDNNIALGNQAGLGITASDTVSAGTQAMAQSNNDIAIGSFAVTAAGTNGNNVAMGNGVTTGDTGQNVAIGSGTTTANSETADGGAVAIGRDQTATGDGAVAIGDPNRVNGSGSVAMGRDNTAAGSADASTAANGAVAIGDTNSAIGQGSVAIGRTSTAAAAGGLAFGDTANAQATRGVALGSGSTAVNADDVALGAGSQTAAAVGTASTVINGTTYNFAGTAPGSTVSVGDAGAERTITNVAAGRISGTSTDAINGSQLYATNQAVEVLGQGWNLTTSGNATGTSVAAVQPGQTFTLDGGTNIQLTQNGQTITVATSATPTFDSVTINGGPVLSGTGIDMNGQKITNLAPGTDPGDAVNVSQLSAAATRYYSVNDGGVQGGNFNNDGATGANALAAGVGTQAQADRGTALGFNANAVNADDVALGSNSLTATAVGTASTVINGTTYNFAGAAPGSTVSVGDVGAERTIINVAAGRVSGTSTDAINGSQLFATNTALDTLGTNVTNLGNSTAAAIGAGSSYDPATGQVSPPSFAIAGGNQTSVGDAINALNQGWNLTTSGNATGTSVAAVQPGQTFTLDGGTNIQLTQNGQTITVATSATPTFDSVTINGGPVLSGTGINMNGQKITNLAPGTDPGDAVNVSQLSDVVAGATKYFRATSTLADSQALGTDSVAIGPEAVAQNASDVAMGHGASTADGQSGDVAIGAGSRTAAVVGTPTTTINGTTYNFAGAAPTSTVSFGDVGAERTLTNVAAGRVSATSTDAINGSQLFATNTALDTLGINVTNLGGSTAAAIGGGSSYDPATGQITPPSFNIAGGNQSNISDAINALNQGWNLTTAGNTSGASNTQIQPGSTMTVTGGRNIMLTQNGSEIVIATSATPTFDSVTINGGPVLSGTGINMNGQKITNLAPGTDPGDAVNVSQLGNVVAGATKYFRANSGLDDSRAVGGNSVAIGPVAVANGAGSVALGHNARADSANSVALGTNSVAEAAVGTSSTTINGRTYQFAGTAPESTVSVGSQGRERTITNVAAGRISATSTDAINGSQLYATNLAVGDLATQIGNVGEAVKNVVVYDTDANGNRTNSVSLVGGDPNAPVVIHNVAAGTARTDAVNVGQLNDGLANNLAQSKAYTDQVAGQTLGQANAYTDAKFAGLNADIVGIRREARQGAAVGLAAASLRYDDRPGKVSASVGGGAWRGQGALAFGVGYTSENGLVRANLSGTTAGGQWGVAAGLSITLN